MTKFAIRQRVFGVTIEGRQPLKSVTAGATASGGNVLELAPHLLDGFAWNGDEGVLYVEEDGLYAVNARFYFANDEAGTGQVQLHLRNKVTGEFLLWNAHNVTGTTPWADVIQLSGTVYLKECDQLQFGVFASADPGNPILEYRDYHGSGLSVFKIAE